MKRQNIRVGNIPAIVWGNKSDKVYVYVHGKMSSKENARDFAEIAEKKGYQTLSFDLPEHGDRKDSSYRCDIWNGINDLTLIRDYAFSNWNNVSLFGCSLGAYFSLHAYTNCNFANCLFQSPILNMEYLIKQMFNWFNVTEVQLHDQKEILTPIDLLRWDYYKFVKEHPVKKWNIPTSILYGIKDNMQSMEIIKDFAKSHNCKLEISQNSDHSFMQKEDAKIVHAWFEENI